MIDPNILRKNPDKIKEFIKAGRGDPEKADIDRWLELDDKRSELIVHRDEINQERNKLADLGKKGKIDEVREKSRALKTELSKTEDELRKIEEEWQGILDWMPNIPIEMPEGKGEEENVVLKAWRHDEGYIKDAEGKLARAQTEKFMPKSPPHADKKKFEAKNHLDLGEELGIIDMEQAAKVSGSRFTYLIGDLVLLQFAVQQFVMQKLVGEEFKPIVPPLLVKKPALYGTSHFPEGRDQIYAIETEFVEENQELFLVGSTEPSNFAYFMDRTLDEKELPIKLFAYSPAFRSEAGSWGRDTRGIKRLHQFDIIEMNVVCAPEKSEEIFDELLEINEWLLQELKLPYQLALKCTGDAGYLASAKQVDPEVWLPSQGEFMEVMTDTNTTDYQARRLNIKYKTKDGKREYVHTVNDTGVAMGRILIAIMDNYQQSDGSILVPEVLQEFVGKEKISG